MSWVPPAMLVIVWLMSLLSYWTSEKPERQIERSVALACATTIAIVVWLSTIGALK